MSIRLKMTKLKFRPASGARVSVCRRGRHGALPGEPAHGGGGGAAVPGGAPALAGPAPALARPGARLAAASAAAAAGAVAAVAVVRPAALAVLAAAPGAQPHSLPTASERCTGTELILLSMR